MSQGACGDRTDIVKEFVSANEATSIVHVFIHALYYNVGVVWVWHDINQNTFRHLWNDPDIE